MPQTREELEALPGVGRKTANVILNTAFGQPTIAVDTHIFRVANRTGIAPGKDVLEVEKKLLKFVPDEFKHDAHHWLILHGRYVCQARKPKCGACIIRDLCEYKGRNNPDSNVGCFPFDIADPLPMTKVFNHRTSTLFLFESWRKRRARELLTPLEDLAAQLIAKHPEYFAVLENPQQYQEKDYSAGAGRDQSLPAPDDAPDHRGADLHRPAAGIRAQFVRLTQKLESEHDAQHRMMECLSEMIWQAQRNRTQPDAAVYFACLENNNERQYHVEIEILRGCLAVCEALCSHWVSLGSFASCSDLGTAPYGEMPANQHSRAIPGIRRRW